MIHPHPSMEGKNVFHWQKQLRRAEFTPATFTTLFMLSTYAGRRGEECRPGVDLLMLDTGLSKNSVRTALRDGVNRGFLVQVSPGRWRGSAAVYNLALPRKGSTIDPFKVGKGSIHDPERGQPLTPTNSSTSRAAPGYALGRSAEAAHQAVLDELRTFLNNDDLNFEREELQYEINVWDEPMDSRGEPINIGALQIHVSDTFVSNNNEPKDWVIPQERLNMYSDLVSRIKPHVDSVQDHRNRKTLAPKSGEIELEYTHKPKGNDYLEMVITVPADKAKVFLFSIFQWLDDLEEAYLMSGEVE